MFQPAEVHAFRFVACDFDNATGEAKFEYAFDDSVTFIETFTFPMPDGAIANEAGFRQALFLLSLVAGVSYYKAAAPKSAVIESGAVTARELEILSTIYRYGLGEFAYVNRLALGDRPVFQASVIAERESSPAVLDSGPLIAVGGGKDSCVSIETMRTGPAPVTLASVNQMPPIMNVIKASGLPSLHVGRILSPELFRINSDGAYNGHVPVTAIVSLTLVALALLHGHDAVVMSNEASASVGNTDWDDISINHQWSKSLDAEKLLAELVSDSIAPNLRYFSLLRQMSELEIVRRFAKMDRYFDVFTSCNHAFRIDETRRSQRWCRNCPKCRFVFLAMAPFTNPTRLSGVFGGDMLRDLTQSDGFDALIGWNALKPFECVGEVEESVAAFQMLTEQIAWRDHEVVMRFQRDIAPEIKGPNDLLETPFRLSTEHRIPSHYLELLDATN